MTFTTSSKSRAGSKTGTATTGSALSKSRTGSKTKIATTYTKLEAFMDDMSSEEESVVSHPLSTSTSHSKPVTVTTRSKSRAGSKTGTATTRSNSTCTARSNSRTIYLRLGPLQLPASLQHTLSLELLQLVPSVKWLCLLRMSLPLALDPN